MLKTIFVWATRAAIGITCLSVHGSLQAGIDIAVDLEIGIGKELSPRAVAVEEGGGPPPWAPAHGRRAKAVYHYYPQQGVYRNAETGVWFVYRDGEWSAGARLPSTIRIGSESVFVELGMETAKPHLYHAEVSSAYPAAVAVELRSDSSPAASPAVKKGKKAPPGQAKKRR